MTGNSAPDPTRFGFTLLTVVAVVLVALATTLPGLGVPPAAAASVNPPNPPTWPPKPVPPGPVLPAPPGPQPPVPVSGEQVPVSRVNRIVTLAAHESRTIPITCRHNAIMSDAGLWIRPYGSGPGSPANLRVGAVRSTGEGSYEVAVANTGNSPIEARLFGICISHRTTAGRTLAVSPIFTDTVTVGPGTHTLTLACRAGTTPVAPGFAVSGGPATVSGSAPDGSSGRSLTVRTTAPKTRVDFTLRCLGNRATGPDGSTSELVFHRVSAPIRIGGGPIPVGGGPVEGRLPSCPAGFSPIVTGWKFSRGMVPYGDTTTAGTGMIPGWGPVPLPATGTLYLLCLRRRTGAGGPVPVIHGARMKRRVLLVRSGAATASRSVLVRSVRPLRLRGIRIHRGEVLGKRRDRRGPGVLTTRVRLRSIAAKAVASGQLHRLAVTVRAGGRHSTKVLPV